MFDSTQIIVGSVAGVICTVGFNVVFATTSTARWIGVALAAAPLSYSLLTKRPDNDIAQLCVPIITGSISSIERLWKGVGGEIAIPAVLAAGAQLAVMTIKYQRSAD